jgi:hypothetical protein
MTINGNEMTIIKGETFTIDRTIVNRDGSPFIVSSEYNNPYLLLTVSSTRYSQEDRYVANWWLDLTDLPRFKSTVPIQIDEFSTTKTTEDEPGENLYYVDDITKCKYFDDKDRWHDYEFRLVHSFLHATTCEWNEQTYLYSIRLVAGLDMDTYIKNLYNAVFYEDAPLGKTTEELYEMIKNYDDKFVKDLDISRKLATFDVVQDILVPTKLTVLSDLNGGLL